MVIQQVRIKTELDEATFMKVANERAPQFRAIPGLIQKYYARDAATGEYWGLYFWDSMDSVKQFRESELARTIPLAYEATEDPVRSFADVLLVLRS